MSLQNDLFSLSVELVRQYGLRAIDEESRMVGENKIQRINRLHEFTVDTKSSSRFFTVTTARELYELYHSVAVDDQMCQYIHGGATYLILSIGYDNYKLLSSLLAKALHDGFSYPENKNTIDTVNFTTIAISNPWLVFCIMTRFAWFGQPRKDSDEANSTFSA